MNFGFRKITFNEPVEQLLFLAAEHLKLNNADRKTESEIKSALSIAKKSRAFNINPDYATEVSAKLFPLDLIAANILTLSLQKIHSLLLIQKQRFYAHKSI